MSHYGIIIFLKLNFLIIIFNFTNIEMYKCETLSETFSTLWNDK